jgi:dTDP-L-rhamnose 4-epimerase
VHEACIEATTAEDTVVNVLITGGAGFIGSRLARRLLEDGHRVTIIDNLSRQVHGPDATFPQDLAASAECVEGDVCDPGLMSSLVADKHCIVHLAAETGTGQSMYDITHYERVNVHGTAVLLESLVNNRSVDLAKVIVASSSRVYGEGAYECPIHKIVHPGPRDRRSMVKGQFDPICPHCGGSLTIAMVAEDAPFAPASFYGLTKQVQEQMVLLLAGGLNLNAFALRYQNVYGPGQSLHNPYTGILAIFFNLARAGEALEVFEDGQESRDFVHVDDIVEATTSCMAPDVKGRLALNVGSGVRTSVKQVAEAISGFCGNSAPVTVTGVFRAGDVRHNVADISRIRDLTGFSPRWELDRGLTDFLEWASAQPATSSGYEKSMSELVKRGLLGNSSA